MLSQGLAPTVTEWGGSWKRTPVLGGAGAWNSQRGHSTWPEFWLLNPRQIRESPQDAKKGH